ncbi:MAG: SRPBCC family protein [Oscillochloris sp.]|nr:SRPBCC family protein [Oscillochloris sp.]
MITVTRRSFIEGVTPAQIFAALSDPNMIGRLLPRVQKVEMLARDDQARKARLVTHMSMGGIFGTIRCEGDLTWTDDEEIVFNVRNPLPVQTRWKLSAGVNGTQIEATMGLDLAPMLGPMAAFVPTQQVADMLAVELEGALKSIGKSISGDTLKARAVAA